LPALATSVQDIQETLEHTKRNLADTVWAINPEKDKGEELWRRMDKFAHKLLDTGQTELRFNNTLPAGKPFKISMEQRFNALMIFKEAVHNIHKHAAATAVDISIQPHPEGVCVDIRDNGLGFDPTAERDGNGVNNYFRRAKDSFIDFSLDTAPGKGTAIRMIIPEL
jgi:signal transduction histidine kinase